MDTVRVHGEVVRGLQQGRILGYPTINVAYEGALDVRPGVYAAHVRGPEGIELCGAAVVGGDFVESLSPKLEVHVLHEICADRYGQIVSVELLSLVSELARIADLEDLRQKIAADIAAVEQFFNICLPESSQTSAL